MTSRQTHGASRCVSRGGSIWLRCIVETYSDCHMWACSVRSVCAASEDNYYHYHTPISYRRRLLFSYGMIQSAARRLRRWIMLLENRKLQKVVAEVAAITNWDEVLFYNEIWCTSWEINKNATLKKVKSTWMCFNLEAVQTFRSWITMFLDSGARVATFPSPHWLQKPPLTRTYFFFFTPLLISFWC